MFFASMVDDSPTREFTTSAALTGGAFTAVALGENGVATAAAGDTPIGIITAEYELPIAANAPVTVQVRGGCLWTVGEAVKPGDLLAVGADGKAAKAASGDFVFAQAITAATANSAAHVLITRGGKA